MGPIWLDRLATQWLIFLRSVEGGGRRSGQNPGLPWGKVQWFPLRKSSSRGRKNA